MGKEVKVVIPFVMKTDENITKGKGEKRKDWHQNLWIGFKQKKRDNRGKANRFDTTVNTVVTPTDYHHLGVE